MNTLERNMHLPTLIVVILAGVMYFLGILHLSLSNYDVFISPDENTTNLFVEHYAKTGKLSFDQIFNFSESYALVPRSSVNYNSQIVPFLPFGLNIISGTYVSVHPVLGTIAVPLMLVGLVALQYLLLKQFIPYNWAVVGTVITALLPPFIHFGSRSKVLDIPMLYMFSLGLYYFFKSKLFSRKLLIISGLFLGATLFINQKSIFWLASLAVSQVIYFSIDSIKTKSILSAAAALKKVPLILIGALPMALLILYGNYQLFGNAFKNGYVVQGEVNASLGAAPKPLFFLELHKVWFNNTRYLFGSFVPVLGITIILGAIYQLQQSNKAKWFQSSYVYFFIFLLVITTLYFSNLAAWGSAEPTLTASYLRYLLPIFFFGIVFAVIFMFRYISKQFLTILLSLLVVLMSISFFIGPGGYSSIAAYNRGMAVIRSFVLNETSQNSVIFTNSLDKIIYPYRQTVNLQSLPVVSEANLYPEAAAIVRLIHSIPDRHSLFYIEEDTEFTVYLQKTLSVNGIGLIPQASNESIALYRISKNSVP